MSLTVLLSLFGPKPHRQTESHCDVRQFTTAGRVFGDFLSVVR